MRLRNNLVVLVIATALPLVLLAVLASYLLVSHEQANFTRAVKDRNRAFMTAVDAEIQGHVATLQALTSLRSIVRGDLKAVHADLVAAQLTQASWLDVFLSAPDGRQVVVASAQGAHVWDAGSGRLLKHFPDQVMGAFSADGRRLVTCGSAAGAPYSGVAFFQDRRAPAGSTLRFNGNSAMSVGGAIYAANGDVEWSGNNGTTAPSCTQIVARTITFIGNAALDDTGCQAAGAKPINVTSARFKE